MAITANNFYKDHSSDSLVSEHGASDDEEQIEIDPFEIVFDNAKDLVKKIPKHMLTKQDFRGNTLLTLAGKLCQ